MNSTTATPRPTLGAKRNWLLLAGIWLLQLFGAFIFGSSGAMKLGGAPEMLALFTAIGVGQWLRMLVGALELAGAIGLLVPRLAGLAALGLACVMLGATTVNLLVLHTDAWLTCGLLLLNALIVWARWPIWPIWRR